MKFNFRIEYLILGYIFLSFVMLLNYFNKKRRNYVKEM